MKVFGLPLASGFRAKGFQGRKRQRRPNTGVSINGWVPYTSYSEISISFWEPPKGTPHFWKLPFKNRRFRMSDAGAFLFRKA